MTEVSTPFVNYRSMMLTLKQSDSILFKLNIVVFAALFFLSRVIFQGLMVFRVLFAMFYLYDVRHKVKINKFK